MLLICFPILGVPLMPFRCRKLIGSATVHGVDLYPPPAEWVPPNCIFEVDDFTKPWSWGFKFDLVYMRFLAGALLRSEWSKTYKRIYQ